ncbi:uncharacterized protein LOC132061337 [Lycium ferocissimum]|uniref:uncharacterized protein LOC132061337 n=1 Tax=Lycium ferocissimum TaxID=112874 RepID=UPI0028153E5B|nr:uncharacterized protein LOC132061337 [Lycium ferocissimum]
MIFEEQNTCFGEIPSEDEVKVVIFSLNGESAPGPDGFIGIFYQSCWEIIKDDIINKAGFVKGRSIVENVLLTQEIVSDIRLRTKSANVVMKLDMAKAYDRVSWIFLMKVLRKIGFSELVIDMIFRLVSSNWGVKQGDPLSRTLFILTAEVLSKNLNSLNLIPHFKGCGMPKWSPKVKHLSYADGMIIFSSADVFSLQLIMEVLRKYENTSGQKINRDKSVVYMHKNVPGDVSITVEIVTGIVRKDFPLIYLGCPIYHSRRRKDFFTHILMKIMNRLQSWKGKLLSFGGRTILMKHVLQSLPIHLLSAVNPHIGVIRQMHKMFAQFFWSNTIGGKSRHWASWNHLCLPIMEGGMGFRSLHDVSSALFCKLWWNFRTKPSLWSAFMVNKYCRKESTVTIQWKHGMGALYFTVDGFDENIQNILDVVENGNWNMTKLNRLSIEGLTLQQIIVKWWTAPVKERGKLSFQAIPAIIMWEIWKRRNTIKHGGKRSVRRVIYLVYVIIQRLVMTRNPSITQVPHKWPDLIQMLEEGCGRLKVTKVRWNVPPTEWLLCNTDGASRGNPGRNAYGFCLRNSEGGLRYAHTAEIGITTNIYAEVMTILQAMRFYKNENLDNVIVQTDCELVCVQDFTGRVETSLGNKLADALANQALDEANFECHGFQQLSSTCRKILNSDKSQIPYMRVRIKK